MFMQFLRRLMGKDLTVANVMYDFQYKIKQLQAVAKAQRLKAAKEALKAEKALKAQDKAHSEAHFADKTIEALETITKQTTQLSLADLKKEVK